MGTLFGTDGVRGKVNVELTSELAYFLGKASVIKIEEKTGKKPKVLVGKDTRISCDMLESALIAGMCSVGAKVYTVGVVPTPCVAFLTRTNHFDAGVMISASHNPFQDNGIKFFNEQGYKLSDDLENQIEKLIEDGFENLEKPTGADIGNVTRIETALDDYKEFLKSTLDVKSFENLKVIVDCANGATYKIAENLFKELNVDVEIMFNNPTGININENCGSTHMEQLISRVKETKADLGIAFDGDGDRCLLVDEKGKLVDGDEIMSIIGNSLLAENKLKEKTIVATIMSNLGLFKMGEELGINVAKTKVGDRYVLEEMIEKGYNFGGEQSGHIIFLDHNTTGDGILTSLQILQNIKKSNKSLSKLNSYMKIMPQVLVNLNVTKEFKDTYEQNKNIIEEIEKLNKKYSNNGRILIRASGTENLVRIMIEGEDLEIITKDANEMAEIMRGELK